MLSVAKAAKERRRCDYDYWEEAPIFEGWSTKPGQWAVGGKANERRIQHTASKARPGGRWDVGGWNEIKVAEAGIVDRYEAVR